MNVLALEASTEVSSVALLYRGKIWEEVCEEPRSHSKVILPKIDKLLNIAGIALTDLDSIALTNGPGSFTGIRICVGIAQGLAFGSQLPVFAVSTLEAMAWQASVELQIREPQTIAVLLDARMGEIYWATFKVAKENGLRQLQAPQVSPISLVQGEMEAREQKTVYIGHGCSLIDPSRLTNASLYGDFKPRASGILLKMQAELARGKKVSLLPPGELVEPLYLRNEVTWEKRKRLRMP